MKVSFAAAACDRCDVFSDRAFAGSAVDLLTRTGFSLGGLGGWYELSGQCSLHSQVISFLYL